MRYHYTTPVRAINSSNQPNFPQPTLFPRRARPAPIPEEGYLHAGRWQAMAHRTVEPARPQVDHDEQDHQRDDHAQRQASVAGHRG